MKPLEIRKASPHELVVVLACCLAGTYALIDPAAESAALVSSFVRWALVVFNVAFVVGGLLVFVGVLVAERALRGRGGDLADGLSIERVGLGLGAPLIASYSVAVFAAGGLRGLLPGLLCLGIAAANLLRMRRITLDLRAWAIARADPHPADPPPLGMPDPRDGEA